MCCYLRATNESHDLPPCYYRCDVPHLLRIIKKWKCFNSVGENVINFYLRCIGFLTQVDSLNKFKDVTTSILVIANSTLAEVDTECFERINSMTEILKTYQHVFDDFITSATISNVSKNNDLVDEKKDKTDDTNSTKDKLIVFIDNIFENASLLSTNDEKISDQANYYYYPDFTTNFRGLCYSFPSWTNVMMPHYKSPTVAGSSSRSETYFKRKKEQIPYPIALQKFILKDCKKINSLTNYGFINLPRKTDDDIRTEQDLFLNLNLDDLSLITLELPETTNSLVSIY